MKKQIIEMQKRTEEIRKRNVERRASYSKSIKLHELVEVLSTPELLRELINCSLDLKQNPDNGNGDLK